MKILFIAHCLPYPVTDGIRTHVYHLLRELSKKHEIHLYSFIFGPEGTRFVPEVSPFCRTNRAILHPVPTGPIKRISSMLFDKMPFCVRQFHSQEMAKEICDFVEREKPDVVHIDHLPMAQYESFLPRALPKVLLPHDALSMLFESSYRNEKGLARKFYFWNQHQKLKRYETEILPRFDRTVVVSPIDQGVLQRECPAASIEWNPLGVDVEYFHEQPGREKKGTILFRGIMDFFPNHDAAFYFASSVMPLIWRVKKEAVFWVAGNNPMKPLRRLAERDSRIKLLGFVNDLREPMAEASVIVCPMRAGSGMKTKLLEALSMAKAVVATPFSLPGINAHNEQELLLGETPHELAQATLRLLENEPLRQKLGQAGRQLVEREHSWAAHGRFFERIYSEARSAKK